MATNSYFKPYSYTPEQDLYESLIIESIRQYGTNIKYLPRTKVISDNILNEDIESLFSNAIEMEVYPKDVEGFVNKNGLMSKFGDFLRDQITFMVSQKRFSQSLKPKLLDETGRNIITENDLALDFEYEGVEYDIQRVRPFEGDLIWFPMVNRIFEIKFVNREEMFYQFGKLYTYDMVCEIFTYNSEDFETGDDIIDDIFDKYDDTTANFNILLENGDNLVTEAGARIINESYQNEDVFGEQNTAIQKESSGFIKFTDKTPFSNLENF